jgi:hypothetical protein
MNLLIFDFVRNARDETLSVSTAPLSDTKLTASTRF